MIKPIQCSFGSSENNKKKYQDPLNKNGLVLLSYSNEVGTAISEIAPKLGAALWAPTFMYLGADIYDKYKNDKDNYNPSGRRAFKRAIFQGLTSLVAMPAAIILGQYIVSPLGRLHKTGISGNAKDAIYRHTKNIIEQAHGYAFETPEKFTEVILNTLENTIKNRQEEKNTINKFHKYYNILFTERYELLKNDKTKLLKFAKENAEKTFEILEALKSGNTKNVPKKILRKYKKILPIMKEMYNESDYSYQATRNALAEYQKSLIFKNKILKTISGLVVLIILAKPINDFVDKKIMKKYISPSIDQIVHKSVNDSKLKNIFNDLKNKSNPDGKSGSTSNLTEQEKIRSSAKSKVEGSL